MWSISSRSSLRRWSVRLYSPLARIGQFRWKLAEFPPRRAKPVSLQVGALSFHLYFIRDHQLRISVSDPGSALRRDAQALVWFPIDSRWRIKADWVPYKQPKRLMFLDNEGSSRERNIPGYVSFQVSGTRLRLTAVLRPENQKSFFVFGDSTNGQKTYGAGRFLDAAPLRTAK